MKKTLSRPSNIDLDQFSTTIVEDLLDSNVEWKGVSDIVRLTIKALTDVVRVQASSIRELTNSLPTRASKTQLATGLSLKANLSNVTQTISQISNTLQQKITLNQLHDVMYDYITKEEFQDALIVKNQIGESKYGRTSNSNAQVVKHDQILREVQKKMAGYVSINEFQQLLAIIEQKPNTNEINQILENKVSKQIFNAALQKLVPRNEMEMGLSKKADITDLQYIVSTLETKVDLSTMQKLTEVIQNKADRFDVQAKLQQSPTNTDIAVILQSIDQLKMTLQRQCEDSQVPFKRLDLLDDKMGTISSSIHTKISHAQTSAMMTNLKYQVTDQLSKLKMLVKSNASDDRDRTVELFSAKELLKQVSVWKKDKETISRQLESLQKRLDDALIRDGSKQLKKELGQMRDELMLGLEEKLSTDQLQQVLTRWVEQIHIKINQDRDDSMEIIKQLKQSTRMQLEQHSSQIIHLNNLLTKQQAYQGSSTVDILKRMRREIDDCRKTVDKAYGEVEAKLNQSQYEIDLFEIKKKLDSFHRDLSLKSNIKDVCVLVDSKPNVEEVNQALKQIHQQLEAKVGSQELKGIITDQATINETLCSENIVGRWLWHSGQVKVGNLVPWEAEAVNTLPDNFLWDRGQTSILALASGLYQITVNVFCKYKPTVSLLINGDVVSTKQLVQEKQNQNQNPKKKKTKQMTSLKIQEFLMVPTRARVSVIYNGEPGSEGFLNVKRL